MARISAHNHRFGGKEFRVGNVEVGHVRNSGAVDIPFPRAFRDELLARGLAEEHRWVPNSGWVTFRIRGDDDVQHAVWLMHLPRIRSRFSKTRVSAFAWILVSESCLGALCRLGQTDHKA